MRVLRRLGGGGMGEVTLAREQLASGESRLVVLKQLHAHLAHDAELVRMFEDEGRLAARLLHPNVCRLLEVGRLEGRAYLAFEHIDGADLARLLRRSLRGGLALPLDLCAHLAAEAARGLHAAHELRDEDGAALGLVHRDLSPSNIMVRADGQVMVIDFGLAKAAGRLQQTLPGVLKGKAAYMSPEQASGGAVDRRSDVFALGAVLHELLTGRALFAGSGRSATWIGRRGEGVAPPSSLRSDVPTQLDQIVLRALARAPGARFQSAEELADQLQAWLGPQRAERQQQLVALLVELELTAPPESGAAGRAPEKLPERSPVPALRGLWRALRGSR